MSGKHFQIEVGYDDQGLTVTVVHKLSGRKRMARPKQGESVASVECRLTRELAHDFVDLKDFVFRIGRCKVNGRAGDWYEIEHILSGRKKSLDTISNPDIKRPQEELWDLFIEELWQEGLLTKGNEASS